MLVWFLYLFTLPPYPGNCYPVNRCPDKYGMGETMKDDYVTIMKAAQLCGVSDKTIQRAIRRGTLPARYPLPNRCEIAVSDLERLRPGHVSGQTIESLACRIARLEQQVTDLEQQLRSLKSSQPSAVRHYAPRAKERTTGPLPKHLVPLLVFAQQHSIPEQKALSAIDMELLPVKRGEWVGPDGSAVLLALDVKGREAFYQIYCNFPFFTHCVQCPHGYQDTSV